MVIALETGRESRFEQPAGNWDNSDSDYPTNTRDGHADAGICGSCGLCAYSQIG